MGFLEALAGSAAGSIEDSNRSAAHESRMAGISADNATAAANIAARNSKVAADAAGVAAHNSGLAVDEGREQTQQILDQLAKGVKEYIMPAVNQNNASIAALTDLVKADIAQNKGINARLDRLEQQINGKTSNPE